jgi:hypothetical protein
VTVPRGVTIRNAFVQFEVDEPTSQGTSLTIAGQASDRAPSFTSADRNVSARPRTTATVSWSPAAWPTEGAGRCRGTYAEPRARHPGDREPQRLDVRERARASSSRATGRRVARSFDGQPDGAPRLRIDYDLASIPTDDGHVDRPSPPPASRRRRYRPAPRSAASSRRRKPDRAARGSALGEGQPETRAYAGASRGGSQRDAPQGHAALYAREAPLAPGGQSHRERHAPAAAEAVCRVRRRPPCGGEDRDRPHRRRARCAGGASSVRGIESAGVPVERPRSSSRRRTRHVAVLAASAGALKRAVRAADPYSFADGISRNSIPVSVDHLEAPGPHLVHRLVRGELCGARVDGRRVPDPAAPDHLVLRGRRSTRARHRDADLPGQGRAPEARRLPMGAGAPDGRRSGDGHHRAMLRSSSCSPCAGSTSTS